MESVLRGSFLGLEEGYHLPPTLCKGLSFGEQGSMGVGGAYILSLQVRELGFMGTARSSRDGVRVTRPSLSDSLPAEATAWESGRVILSGAEEKHRAGRQLPS